MPSTEEIDMDASENSVNNDCAKLAEVIARRWFDGTLPRCPHIIVQAVLKTVTPDLRLLEAIPAGVREEAKRRFADALLVALSDRIAAQDADAQSPFQN
jgi:hypothetical protein